MKSTSSTLENEKRGSTQVKLKLGKGEIQPHVAPCLRAIQVQREKYIPTVNLVLDS